MLLGSSTTQILLLSRDEAVQTSHGSVSVILKQTEQKSALSLISFIAAAIAFASSAGKLRMKKASLCAVFLPMPGSLVSWVNKIVYYTLGHCKTLLFPEHITQTAESGDIEPHGKFRHLIVHHLLRPPQ